MCTMNQSLANHVKAGAITMDEAVTRTSDPEDLKRLMARS